MGNDLPALQYKQENRLEGGESPCVVCTPMSPLTVPQRRVRRIISALRESLDDFWANLSSVPSPITRPQTCSGPLSPAHRTASPSGSILKRSHTPASDRRHSPSTPVRFEMQKMQTPSPLHLSAPVPATDSVRRVSPLALTAMEDGGQLLDSTPTRSSKGRRNAGRLVPQDRQKAMISSAVVLSIDHGYSTEEESTCQDAEQSGGSDDDTPRPLRERRHASGVRTGQHVSLSDPFGSPQMKTAKANTSDLFQLTLGPSDLTDWTSEAQEVLLRPQTPSSMRSAGTTSSSSQRWVRVRPTRGGWLPEAVEAEAAVSFSASAAHAGHSKGQAV